MTAVRNLYTSRVTVSDPSALGPATTVFLSGISST